MMETKMSAVFAEVLANAKNAAIVLEKCVDTGILREENGIIGYTHWHKKKDDWFHNFRPIAVIIENNGETAIKWADDICSPAGLLEKLITKYQKKTKSVANLNIPEQDQIPQIPKKIRLPEENEPAEELLFG